MRPSKKQIKIIVLAIALCCIGLLLYAFFSVPDVSVLRSHYPVIKVMDGGKSTKLLLTKTPPSSWVNLKNISKEAIRAIVISEDWAFYQHKGFDTKQIKEAFKKNWRLKRYARGASTITQQVARNVFFERKKSLWRKVKELFTAMMLERKLSKRRILEIYLNIAEWGDNIYGIRTASRHYFEKHPSLLNTKEGAFLAMLLPSPKRYSASFRKGELTQYAKDTIETLFQKLVQAGYLSEEEAIFELSTPLSFETTLDEPRFEWFPSVNFNNDAEEEETADDNKESEEEEDLETLSDEELWVE